MTAPRKNYQMNQENASERFLERTNRISSEESPGDVPSIRKSRKEILGKNLQRLTDKDPQRTNPPLPSPPIHHISTPVPAPSSQNPRPNKHLFRIIPRTGEYPRKEFRWILRRIRRVLEV